MRARLSLPTPPSVKWALMIPMSLVCFGVNKIRYIMLHLWGLAWGGCLVDPPVKPPKSVSGCIPISQSLDLCVGSGL